jgi:hypothetical protein
MRLEEAFNKVVEVEARIFAGNPVSDLTYFWPLMRQCLWLELIQQAKTHSGSHAANKGSSIIRRISNRIVSRAIAISRRPSSIGEETTAFISRPVYLQRLPDGCLFDRIVDPLVFCLPNSCIYSKYYLAPWSIESRLSYQASLLRPFSSFYQEIPQDHRSLLALIACWADIDVQNLLFRYSNNLSHFYSWLLAARHFFDNRKNLRNIYLTSWYFPDMMALIAAARERGITTIDVQHGKQGKFQAMYCGWHIYGEGFQLMPNIFWNWGKPSAEHILTSSPDRMIHRPVIGGFPWLDYYSRNVRKESTPNPRITAPARRVLITVQSPQGKNIQPIPDFLLDYLSQHPPDVVFVFRCHPNDPNGPDYCRHRLSALPRSLYTIDEGHSNLYDSLISSTHHITAYSSCCYEASAFGVPTLLFGEDAQAVYNDEIKNGLFSWTPGVARDLASWLDKVKSVECMCNGGYISSSLEQTSAILRNAEEGSYDYYFIRN